LATRGGLRARLERAVVPAIDLFDLLVIGAGINGAAIARDAALRGLTVALVEQDDIGSGTTAWSSRLIHGGLRYLEPGEVGLVRESLRERELLLRNAPHLVQPLQFLLPLFAGAGRSPVAIRAGLTAYDLLSPRQSMPRHRMLHAADALRLESGLAHDDLRGAALYWDAQATFPERLALENALDARAHGAQLFTHTRVVALTRAGARISTTGGAERELSARAVVNATGPWLDELHPSAATQPLIGGTQGSHIVVGPFVGSPQRAIYSAAHADGRPFFVIPWLGRYLIGATDTRFTGDPGAVVADAKDRAYLLAETIRLFPHAKLTDRHILFSYAGVRPLPYQPRGAEGSISRRHFIYERERAGTPQFDIIGGKLTTHRRLAEQVVDRVCARLTGRAKCRTAAAPLPGAAKPGNVAARLARDGIDQRVAARLAQLYGARADGVVALGVAAPWLNEPLAAACAVLRAEVAHAFINEAAESLTDVMLRRVMLGLEPGHGLVVLARVVEVAARGRGWDAARCVAEVAAYRAALRRFGGEPPEPHAATYNLPHER
jgi:glycerol-3-phosphate dehydrogenase